MTRPQPRTVVCPECGRTLTTVVNRFGVETYPTHKYGVVTDQHNADWYLENEGREPGLRDWEVPCQLSRAPVE